MEAIQKLLEPKRLSYRFFPALTSEDTLKLVFHACTLKNAGNCNIAIDGNYTLVPGETLTIDGQRDVITASIKVEFGNVNSGFPVGTAAVKRLEYGLIEVDGENEVYSKLATQGIISTSTNNTNGGGASATPLPVLF